MNWKTEYKVIRIKEGTGKYISNPNNVIDFLVENFNPISEEMYLLIMDIKNQVIEKHLISKGGYNIVLIVPADIFRPLFMMGGNNFIIAHNHPSGDRMPSDDDIKFTRAIEKVSKTMGTSFLDHIIYTSDNKNYYSFKKEGLL